MKILLLVPLLAVAVAVAVALVSLLWWRLHSVHARGMLLRWGVPRASRRGFASRHDVREHLGSSAGRGSPTTVGEDITERDSAR